MHNLAVPPPHPACRGAGFWFRMAAELCRIMQAETCSAPPGVEPHGRRDGAGCAPAATARGELASENRFSDGAAIAQPAQRVLARVPLGELVGNLHDIVMEVGAGAGATGVL